MRAFLLLLLATNVALADDAGLLRCRAIKDSTARLACYDALVVPAVADKTAPAQAAPQAQSATRVPSQAVPAQTPEQFGMEHKSAQAVLAAIESTIPGRFEGWGPNSLIRLANGQVWQVADDSTGMNFVDNPKVRVRRGALGAFYLEIEGTNRSPRVIRRQ
jgi:hypothetical protein